MKTPAVTRQDNFIWLLLGLVLVLFNDALFAQLDFAQGNRLNNALLMIIVFVVVWSIEENQGRWLIWKIAASLLFGALVLSDGLVQSAALSFAQLFAGMLFLCITLGIAWRQVMFVGSVDRNTIVGAVCIYVLLGMICTFIYLIIEELFPGSLAGLQYDTWQQNFDSVFYYSMVTLTTLGYGDITPQQPLAQFFAYAEAVVGIFYTTVLVASLIGMQLASYSQKIIEQADRTSGEQD